MKKQILIKSLALIIILSACDTTDNYFKGLKEKPEILVKTILDDDFGKKTADSMKISNGYQLFYTVVDIEKLTLKVEPTPETGVALFSYEIDNEKISVSANRQGIGNLKLSVKDSFGKTDEMIIRLTSFDNLPPVAVLEISNYPGFEYGRTLDAAKSYDQDAKYGGTITLYRFLVNGKEIERTYNSFMHYNFPQPGNYEIGLQVLDNDDEWSGIVYSNLTID